MKKILTVCVSTLAGIMLMYGFGSGGIVKCAGGCGLFMNNSSAPLSKPLSVKGFCNVSPGRT